MRDAALLLSCYLSLFCLGFLDNSRGPVYPLLLRDFGLSNSVGAWFFGLTSLFQVLSTLSAPWWLKRWGTIRGLRRFVLLEAFAVVLIGCSYYVQDSFRWPLCLFGATILGVAIGGLAICQNSLVTVAATEKWHRRAFAGLHMMYGLASLVAPLYVANSISSGLSWGQGFASLAALPMCLLGLMYLLTRKKIVHVHQPQSVFHKYDVKQKRIAALLGVYVMAEVAISSRLVLYTVQGGHGSENLGASLLSLFFWGLMLGRLLVGAVHLPVTNKRLLLISASSSLIVFLLGIFVSPYFLSACGFLMAPFFPVAMAWMAENMPSKVEETTTLIMVLQGVALMMLHLLMGGAEQWLSVQAAMMIGPLALLGTMFSLRKL